MTRVREKRRGITLRERRVTAGRQGGRRGGDHALAVLQVLHARDPPRQHQVPLLGENQTKTKRCKIHERFPMSTTRAASGHRRPLR